MANVNLQGTRPKAGAFNAVKKFGRNSAVGAAVEDIFAAGGVKVWPAAAATIYISSDNQAADVGIEITVEYIDANGLHAEVTGQLHATDARTFVSLGVTALDVNRAYLSGDGEALTGNVYVSVDNTDVGGNGIPDDTDDIMAFIPLLDGQTMQATYRVPTDETAFISGWMWTTNTVNATKHSALFRLQVRQPGGSWRTVEASGGELGSNWKSNWDFAEQVAGGSMIRISAISTVAGTDCSASFTIYKE